MWYNQSGPEKGLFASLDAHRQTKSNSAVDGICNMSVCTGMQRYEYYTKFTWTRTGFKESNLKLSLTIHERGYG